MAAQRSEEVRFHSEARGEGRKCLEELTSFCSVCRPRAWTWCSDIPAARLCRCTTRLTAAESGTSSPDTSMGLYLPLRDTLALPAKWALPSRPADQVRPTSWRESLTPRWIQFPWCASLAKYEAV